MKRYAFAAISILAFASLGTLGCSREVSHHESDKPTLLGNGRVHEEDTTYRNPDGTYSTEHTKTKTANP